MTHFNEAFLKYNERIRRTNYEFQTFKLIIPCFTVYRSRRLLTDATTSFPIVSIHVSFLFQNAKNSRDTVSRFCSLMSFIVDRKHTGT